MSDGIWKAATFNINSVRVRLEQLLAWLEREQPDVLGLQETKAQDADFPLDALTGAGYHVAFAGQKGGAGVALLTKREPEDVAYGIDDDGEPDRARLVRAVVDGVVVVNTYVPQGREIISPHFAYKLEWFARLHRLFERHYTPTQPLLWMGDLNVAPAPIDIYDPKGLAEHVDFHPAARAALAETCSWGFVDLLRQHHPDEAGIYTYWDYRARNPIERGVGWRIDHLMATEPLAVRSRRVWVDLDARRAERPSDHTLLVGEFER